MCIFYCFLRKGLARKIRQHLNVLIGAVKFSCETGYLGLEFPDQPYLRVYVHGRLVGDLACLGRVSHSGDILFDEAVCWGQTRYHEAVRVATDTLFKQGSQLRISVGHMRGDNTFLRLALVGKGGDDFSKSE